MKDLLRELITNTCFSIIILCNRRRDETLSICFQDLADRYRRQIR